VVQRATGVPLFVEELTRDLLEHGEYDSPGQIPATLHDSLMARLDRLGRARELAQIGAAIGREFSHELIRTVASISEDELKAALEPLINADLLYVHKGEPDKHYIFKHALVRDAAYGTILKSRRRELHQRIAGILEERFPEIAASAPELLAHHYTEAGLAAQAVRYWRRAGRRATERSANLEAIAQLRKGLELLKALPPTSEHLMEEVKLQIALTTPLIATAGYTAPEVEKAGSRALELCQQLEEAPQLFAALGTLWSVYFNRGELEIALELARRMLRIADTRRDPALLLWAHYFLGFTLAWQGILKSARDHLERSIALYDPRRGGTYGSVQDPGPTAMALLSHVVHWLGYPEQALGKMREAVAGVRNLSHPFTLAWVLGSAGALHWRRGEKLAAQELWAEQVAICSEQGFKALLTLASLRIGFGQVEKGRAENGLGMMHDAVRSLTDTPVSDNLLALGFFAFALGKIGQLDHGLARIDEALTLADKGPNFVTSMLYRYKGELILMKSPRSLRKAQQCFNVAIKIARNQKAKSDELAAAIPLARLLAQQGHREQAHAMLSKIYNWFTEGFDTADLKEAKALLEQLQS
jgi:tetratricopeptide (TPR) repeat protein